jgi:hypothetical protein
MSLHGRAARQYFLRSSLLRGTARADKRSTTVHDQDLAGDVTGLVGQQEAHGAMVNAQSDQVAVLISQPSPGGLALAIARYTINHANSRHSAGDVAGVGVAACRMIVLARAAAEACSPISQR